MTQENLAAACAEAGAPSYTAMVIHRLENNQRQVKVNDAFALASVLGVSPLVLLMPATAGAKVMLTGSRSERADRVYEWMVGLRPAPTTGEVNDRARANAWLRLRKYLPYASRASGTLRLEFGVNEEINQDVVEFLRDNQERED